MRIGATFTKESHGFRTPGTESLLSPLWKLRDYA